MPGNVKDSQKKNNVYNEFFYCILIKSNRYVYKNVTKNSLNFVFWHSIPGNLKKMQKILTESLQKLLYLNVLTMLNDMPYLLLGTAFHLPILGSFSLNIVDKISSNIWPITTVVCFVYINYFYATFE